MLLIVATFVLTTAGYGFLVWLSFRRVATHLQGNPEAVKAVTDHVLLPLLGRKGETEGKNEG